MPGAYAHLTLANLARSREYLDAGPGMPRSGVLALERWHAFCELGAVSPDFPYHAVGAKTAGKWADLMHGQYTGTLLRAAIERVKALNGTRREKAFVWLLGYAAHAIADATIHPVVQLQVGPYSRNKEAHRRCEAHQDVYIFKHFKTGGLDIGDYLESSIERCSMADGSIDPAVADLWKGLLARFHPDVYRVNPPDLWRWNKGFTATIEAGSRVGHLFPLARHISSNSGMNYPQEDEVDYSSYVDQLETPHGRLSYDEIFDKTLTHVLEGWHLIGDAVFSGGTQYQEAFWDWNLDTGRDARGRIVFWDEAA